MKWTGAVVLAASLVEVSAMNARTDLMKHAVKATQGVPALREKERKRRLAFKTKMENLIQSKPQRKLQNNNGYYGNYNYGQNQGNYNGNQGGQGNYNGNQAQNNYNGQGQDYNGYWYGNDYNYEWNQEMAEEEFGFDISAYSIKYTGCHTVETYNEMLAENDQFETVLGTQRYATFRLCPVEYCNTNNKWGCDQNYGEYVVPLGNYVESIVEYGQERVQAYCEFCEDCAAREAYRSWARSQINQMEYDMQLAEQLYEQFKQNMQRQNAYDNAEAQGGGYYMQDADYYENDEESDATYMMAYYKRISNMQGNNNGNNGNGNGNNNGGNYNQYNQNQNPQNNYNFYNQNMWKFSSNQQYQQNEQEQNQNQVNQDYWSNMGQFATFNGHSIYPGYFTNQGEFVAGWGYFYQGNWVSMEDQEVVWDENLYGEAPDAWQNYIGEDPDGLEVCEYEYSSGCYQNYDQCMMYLAADGEDDDWYPDWYNVDYDYNENNNGNNNKANQNYQNYVEQQQQKEENQFLAMTGQMFACHQVIYNPEWDGDYNENYQNQQYTNAQMYQLNKYMEYKLEECGQDENCIYDVETQMQQNQEFMEWLQEYNEKLYDQWINGEKLFYIGASCDDDGGIKLSVYNDEDCSYEDSTVTAEKVLGFDITDYMNYDLIPDQCIPCDNQVRRASTSATSSPALYRSNFFLLFSQLELHARSILLWRRRR